MKSSVLTLGLRSLLLLVSAGVLAAGEAAPRVVKIRSGVDNAMKFDVTSITAAPGESLKVVLANACSLPKTVMGHNWVLLAAGTDPQAFANAAAADAAGGYIPAAMKDKVLATVGLLGPNETGEVSFKAPSKPGEYPFVCSFPAHCIVGMKGVLIVK
jgi:azurin